MGADFLCIGSRRLASSEVNVDEIYRLGVVAAAAAEVVYSNLFTGVHGSYLRQSIINSGLDPDNVPQTDKTVMNFGAGSESKITASV